MNMMEKQFSVIRGASQRKILSVCLVLAALQAFPLATAQEPKAAEGKKKQILLMRPGKEAKESNEAQAALEKLGQQTGLWNVVVTYTGNEVLDPVELAKFDVVFTHDCQPGPEATWRPPGVFPKNLFDWISKGGALIAFHSSFLNREYGQFLGGERQGHPWGGWEPVPFVNSAPGHPIMKGTPPEFQLAEEIFDWNLRDTRLFPENFHLLISVDMAKAKPKVDHAVPVAGCAEHGQGRIYFNHWGHWGRTFHDMWFQGHLTNVFRWATKMDEGSPTQPNPDYTKFEDAKAFVTFHADKEGMPQAGFGSFYAMTATTHPALAKTHVETVAKLRKGEGSIPESLKSLSRGTP